MVVTVPNSIATFFDTPTPAEWVREACDRLPELLHDHANCELKAASTALGFIYRYPGRAALAHRMSRLAREELRHFEQVRRLMAARRIPFRRLSASRYASTLHEAVRREEPLRLVDTLLVGALIEARSCERFAALVPLLPGDLADFYRGLLRSEARHFEQYLAFAEAAADRALAARLGELRAIENGIIAKPDTDFRFHSGPPAAAEHRGRTGVSREQAGAAGRST